MLAKPTPRNVNLGNDRFAMFNKERDTPEAQSSNGYAVIQINAVVRFIEISAIKATKNPPWACHGGFLGSEGIRRIENAFIVSRRIPSLAGLAATYSSKP